MTASMLTAKPLDKKMLSRIGRVTSEWSWVETLVNEMLSHFCHADPGSMYVLTQNVSNSTVTGWLRTLTEIQVKDPKSSAVILNLLTEIDQTRTERNTVVHGTWVGHEDVGFAFVSTFKWERSEVAKSELWSSSDLDDLIAQIEELQRELINLGLAMGFLNPTGN